MEFNTKGLCRWYHLVKVAPAVPALYFMPGVQARRTHWLAAGAPRSIEIFCLTLQIAPDRQVSQAAQPRRWSLVEAPPGLLQSR